MERKNLQVCLSKKTLIFYAAITPFIAVASFYNLINIINGEGSLVTFGAFAIFGFVLMPLMIFSKYRSTKCTIMEDRVKIFKSEYPFSEYDFKIEVRELPFKDRPLYSSMKKEYARLVILEKDSKSLVFEEELDVFRNDIDKMRNLIPFS